MNRSLHPGPRARAPRSCAGLHSRAGLTKSDTRTERNDGGAELGLLPSRPSSFAGTPPRPPPPSPTIFTRPRWEACRCATSAGHSARATSPRVRRSRAAIGSSSAWRARDSRRTDPAHSSAPRPPTPRHPTPPIPACGRLVTSARPLGLKLVVRKVFGPKPAMLHSSAHELSGPALFVLGLLASEVSTSSAREGQPPRPSPLAPPHRPTPHPTRTTGISRALDPGPLAPGPLAPRERLPRTQWNVVASGVRAWRWVQLKAKRPLS